MSYYVLRNRYTVPGFLFKAVASWVIALMLVSIILLGIWIFSPSGSDVLTSLPRLLSILLGLCGAYAALGGICLYVTMWIYWIAVERSSIPARIGWLILLLLGVHYGATIYAIYVWSEGVVKVQGEQPVPAQSMSYRPPNS